MTSRGWDTLGTFLLALNKLIEIALFTLSVIAMYSGDWAKAATMLIIVYGSAIMEKLDKFKSKENDAQNRF